MYKTAPKPTPAPSATEKKQLPLPKKPVPALSFPIGWTTGFLFTLLTLCAPLAAWAQTGALGGTVTDVSTGEPLIGVNVQVPGTELGAATDEGGRFRIAPVPAGTYHVVFRYVGFEPRVQTDVVVRPGRSTAVNVALREMVVEGEGVTVTAGYYQRDEAAPVSVTAFGTEEIRRAPGAAQEIVRVLNALPGVASRGETSQDLFVRGGSPAENGFYIDNIPIANPQHFATGDGSSFGPTGLINTAFVETIDFSTGGFPASYGDRLSSVSEIRYRDGAQDGYAGNVGINFAGGQAIAEGPLPGAQGSFFIAGRRSYLDLIADAIDAGGAPRFADAQGKLTLDLGRNHELVVLSLFGTSVFEQDAEDALDAGDSGYGRFANRQNTTGVNWRSLWGGRGYSNTSLSYSYFREENTLDFLSPQNSPLRERNTTQSVTLRNVTRLETAPGVRVEAGAEASVVRGLFDYAQGPYLGTDGTQQPGFERDLSLTRTSAGTFATAILRPLPRLTASLGLRLDYASLNGDVYLSPRASASYQLTDKLAVNAAAGLYRQAVPLFLATQSEANEDLSHLSATHLIVGVEYLILPDTKLRVEGFDKAYRDLPELGDGNPLGDPRFALDARGGFSGVLSSTGKAYARGVDVLLQKKLASGVYGLASASFFRSRYRDAGGVWRDRDFDTRTLFSVVGGYKPSDRWDLSVRWSYLGGRPVAPIDAATSAELGAEVRDVARYNEVRLPAFHSLYVRADRRFFFSSTSLVTFVSLWNAYNRSNVEDLYWNLNTQAVDERTQFQLLPIIGAEFEF